MGRVLSASIVVTALLAAALPHLAEGKGQSAAAPAGPADGAALYQAKCGGCHSIAANKIGPAHRGVFGRKAAMAPGYAYSPALRAANITWNAATLDQWLQGPQKMAKGSKMYLVVPDRAQRAAIIAFLQSDAAK